jgi:hypothetical protein
MCLKLSRKATTTRKIEFGEKWQKELSRPTKLQSALHFDVGGDDENLRFVGWNYNKIICTNSSSSKTARYRDSSVDIAPRLRDGIWTKRRSIPGRGQIDSRVHSASYQMDIEASTPGSPMTRGQT